PREEEYLERRFGAQYLRTRPPRVGGSEPPGEEGQAQQGDRRAAEVAAGPEQRRSGEENQGGEAVQDGRGSGRSHTGAGATRPCAIERAALDSPVLRTHSPSTQGERACAVSGSRPSSGPASRCSPPGSGSTRRGSSS